MPIYEYRCNACARRIQLLFRSFVAAADARCPHCQSIDLRRLPSRVASIRSDSAYEDLVSDPSSLEDIDYSNPRAVAEWARKMGEASGVDMGSDYEEMIEQLEQGSEPDDFDPSGADDEFDETLGYASSMS